MASVSSDGVVKQLKQVFRQMTRSQPGLSPLLERSQLCFAVMRRLKRPGVTYVGVTGSCGKSTTTLLIGAVLSSDGECRTQAGRNLVRKVASNVLSVTNSTKYCVQEVSGSSPGRVRPQVKLLRPQIGVVTTIGGDHFKNFRSLEATAMEKGRLVESLPRHGIAILNADDPHVRRMRTRTRARVITYGLSPDADFRAKDVSSAWPDLLSLTIVRGDEHLRLQTRLVGDYWTTSVLAAVACGIVCGLELEACAKAIASFEPLFGRSSVHSVPDGPNFILETYKAPLWTIANRIAFMGHARAPRKTIIIGTISDYSPKGSRTYRKVAQQALDVADRVVFVGPQAGHVDRLRRGDLRQRLYTFETSYQASAFIADSAIAGELIYIKSSLTDHLERIMLAQLGRVTCWRERCGKKAVSCPACKSYPLDHPPPFGLT